MIDASDSESDTENKVEETIEEEFEVVTDSEVDTSSNGIPSNSSETIISEKACPHPPPQVVSVIVCKK